MSTFFDSIKIQANMGAEKATLTGAGSLDHVPEPLRGDLKQMFAQPQLKVQLLAVVLMSVFSECKSAFLFSRRSLEKILKNHPHVKRRKLSGQAYGDFWGFAVGLGHLEVVRESKGETKMIGKRVIFKGSVLQIANPELIKAFDLMAGEKIRKLQLENAVAVFESFDLEKSQQKSQQKSHKDKDENKNEDKYEDEAKDVSSSGKTGGTDLEAEGTKEESFKETPRGRKSIPSPGEVRNPNSARPLKASAMANNKDLKEMYRYETDHAVNAAWDQADAITKGLSARKDLSSALVSDLKRLYEIICHETYDSGTRAMLLGWFHCQYDCRSPLSANRRDLLFQKDEEFGVARDEKAQAEAKRLRAHEVLDHKDQYSDPGEEIDAIDAYEDLARDVEDDPWRDRDVIIKDFEAKYGAEVTRIAVNYGETSTSSTVHSLDCLIDYFRYQHPETPEGTA